LTFNSGWYNEPNDTDDGSLSQLKVISSVGKNYIVMVWKNAYKIDTGDRLLLTGVKDIAGNISSDWVNVVDDIPPMMKSIVVNPANDTITVVFTERIDGNLNNIAQFNIADLGTGNATGEYVSTQPYDFYDHTIVRDPDAQKDGFSIAAQPATPVDESTVTIWLDDVSYIQAGNKIVLTGLLDNDWKDSGRTENASTDDGTYAYWYGSPLNPGAYYPLDAANLGTRISLPDRIGPRLDRNNVPAIGTPGPIANATVGVQITGICFTEALDDTGTDNATYDPTVEANWTIRIRNCGNDGTCGDAGETFINVANLVITASGPGETYCYDATFDTPTNAGYFYGINYSGVSITVNNVRDLSTTGGTTGLGPNVIDSHNTFTYTAGTSFTGWQRN
jgi:hypothetical protein